ncbi:hypothetical protein OAA78_03345 [Flavobacteriaceae bacterium]|nr:hypothetical protein [Flavobacteriaceae bacterium]
MSLSYIFSIIISLSLSINTISTNFEVQNEIFDGEINDVIKSFHFDKDENTFYYLNNSLILNIINFSTRTNTKISLKITDDLINDTPNNWKVKTTLDTNDDFIKQQNINKIIEKITELHIIKNDEKLYLVDNGGGAVLSIDLKLNYIERCDKSFSTMNKFGGDLFSHNNDIYHFGGYGLYTTNSTLLKYNKSYRSWDEVVYSGEFPAINGLQDFSSLIINDKYYVLGGKSVINQKSVINKDLIYFDFNTKKWNNSGVINYNYSQEDIITSNGELFYIYSEKQLITINVNTLEAFSYERNLNKAFITNASTPIVFNSHFHSDTVFGKDIHPKNIDKETCNINLINYFSGDNASYDSSIFKSYKINDFVDLKSKENLILFKERKSRNEFIIPLILVLAILILNTFYRNYNKKGIKTNKKSYSFVDGILIFKTTEISIDENTRLVLELLSSNEEVSSNDIVARLVENGMSMDYASKIKNKTIERLNEKFEFITGLEQKFIQTLKSREDKRIQIIKLIRA